MEITNSFFLGYNLLTVQKYVIFLFIFLVNFWNHSLQAEETCSRVATINYQEVLVDTSTSKKGEGLRYYLEKDPVAKQYLDIYQERSRPGWVNAAVGTLGTSMLIAGLFTADTPGRRYDSKTILMGGGVAVILLNFMIAKTLEYNTESYFNRAIDEYNQRNLPRIYFTPLKNRGKNASNSLGVGIGLQGEF